MLLLHGWSLDRRAWAPQIPLAERHRLVLIDRRGFGRSAAPPDLAAETLDLLALCERLELDRPILVGMSQGGRIALQFALAYPDRVSGLFLQGTPLSGFLPGPRGEDEVPIDHYRQLVREGRIAEMRKAWGRHALMRDRGAAELLDAYDGRDLLEPASAAPMLAERLGEVSAPTLVVTGADETQWLQLVGDALAYGIPGAGRTRLPGGHLCNLSHAGAYNEALDAFAGGLRR